ncbi:Aspartyl/Asparaginyl beta-hydroxylase [Candidatus Koribacter versatilis Ellin345]|uniref:Aspartyl/Asparaginyl beta-hydroxylase n=1 Tax=Koribacter versatilis (strain Ellin345) TaxID=204669 RepID=Q1IN10_KORVE|nr:aspartyl/asparaginyl beta-hydroxylase domain-containing protein [Candidatus Koribacter versatilis]ABF41740.1 Aspartyl/Asparaginyl beta-hydroxylase [Candidatus Koribacter versatilis Ellin345]
MFTTLKLPFQFDVHRLKADLAQVQPDEWVLHHNRVDYDGGWSGAALRSAGGATRNLILDSGQTADYADTPLLDRCHYFREVLAAFDCQLKSVRLLSLAPQSFIKEHTDRELQYEDGELRIHIPIQTNPRVEFYSNGERLLLEEGSTYYLNANLPHRVSNRGASERVHLVIDAKVTPWVDALFQRSLAENWSVPRVAAEEEFEKFQALLLREPALQAKLRAISNPDECFTTACQLGREYGLQFDKADIHAAKLALNRGEVPGTIELESSAESLRDWVPARVHVREPEPIVEWAHFGNQPFTQPFFEQTLSAATASPFASVFRGYSTLPTAADSARDVEPHGFIFHMTRCGSTLLTQMLATLPENLVVAEAPAIDHVAQADLKLASLSTEQHMHWLRAIVRAMGRPRNSSQSRFFVKLHAWNIHQLPLFRAAFPATPWIFLYRDPLEVLASQLMEPGNYSVPGMVDPRTLQLTAADAVLTDRFGWCSKMLARICESAVRFHDTKALFVNYTALPEAACSEVAKHFGLHLSDDEAEKMRARAQFHSKTPFYWAGKDERPKVLKDEAQRQKATELLGPIYQELKALSS